MEETIELRQLIAIIRKRLWILLLVTAFATAASGVISYFYLTPVYEASTQLLVNQSDRNLKGIYTIEDINTDLKLIETYNVIINSPRIMELVIRELGLPLQAQELAEKVNVINVQNSQVISISVTDENQAQAAEIANGIARVFQREIVKIMNVDNVQILTEAKPEANPVPVKPRPLLNMAIAFAVGMMTGLGIVFLLEYLDTSLRDERDIEQVLQLPTLGSIPLIEHRRDGRAKKAAAEWRAAPAEAAVGRDSYEKA
ncbi:protein-tyrosine kinase activator TkmA [Bacillaceae bacterium]